MPRQIVKLSVATLVMDFALYPRHQIDHANVASIARAINAGVRLDPIVVDSDSHRIIDGFHRCTVYRRADPAQLVDVELCSYPDDAARLLDAIARNARHGERLSRYDQARCVVLADELQIDPARLAAALSLTTEGIGQLRTTKLATDAEGHPVPIKGTIRHLAGTQLNGRRRAAAERTGGLSVRFYVDQVRNAIDGDLIDWSPELVDALAGLRDAIDAALASKAVPA